MRRNWKTIAFGAVAAVGGLLAGRALAEDMQGMPVHQKSIEANGLVKLLSGKWDIKTESGEAATSSFRLGLDKTILLQDFEMKSEMMGGVFAGLGAIKIAEDGKTASLWWFNSHAAKPDLYKGTVSDSGYELTEEGGDGTKLKMVKKGEGLEWTMVMPGMTLTHTYTKAK